MTEEGIFCTLLGQTMHAKLKDLASATPVSELTFDEIMTHLEGHYHR